MMESAVGEAQLQTNRYEERAPVMLDEQHLND